MAVTVVASAYDLGSPLTGGNETTTVAVPGAAQAGDLAIFAVDIPSGNPLTIGDILINTPSGLTELVNSPIDDGQDLRGRAYYKILDGTETVFSATRTSPNTIGTASLLVILRGHNPGVPINAVSATVNVGPLAYPLTLTSITTTAEKSGLLLIHMLKGSDGSGFLPSTPSFTEVIDDFLFGTRHLKVDFRGNNDPGIYNNVVVTDGIGNVAHSVTFLIAIGEGGSKNWEQRDGDNMKTDFQSSEVLQIRLRPFINQSTGAFITGGSDTVSLIIERPSGSLYQNGVSSWTASYDAQVDLWHFDVPLDEFAAGEWRVKATSNASNALPQWVVYSWGAGTAEDVLGTRKFALNRWKVVGTQLLLYEDDGTTIFRTYDLKDQDGVASSTHVFERVPVAPIEV